MQQLQDLIVDLDKVIPILTEGNEDVGPKIRSQWGEAEGSWSSAKTLQRQHGWENPSTKGMWKECLGQAEKFRQLVLQLH
jgi:hypothetical protein